MPNKGSEGPLAVIVCNGSVPLGAEQNMPMNRIGKDWIILLRG
jgi:hypothetical protein